MKVTSFFVSQQLAEAGFKGKINYFYNKDGKKLNYHHYEWKSIEDLDIISFDLETILDALPEKIKTGFDRTPQSKFYFDKKCFGYAKEPKIEFQFYSSVQKNESLADCAARLWLMLKKEGLV